ncbi:MAG TPA: PH domain-containing protein [Allosphingosinicella sp.]|nr:PH domain-containing protein [Allosphingosinicella sp.]
MHEPLDRFRSSTLGWLRGTLAGWGTILLALAGIAGAALGDWGLYPLALTAIALAILVAIWFRNLAASYEICPDRLIVRRGIFIKSIDEVELYRVKDVRLDFSLINQLAGIGTIGITSSDETTRGAALRLDHVERAQSRREQLRGLVEEARQRRRVREIDMMHEDI